MIKKRKMTKVWAIFIAVILMMQLMPFAAHASGGAVAEAPEGFGSAKDPYRIATPGHLLWMSENSDSNSGFSGKSFKQIADIDMTDIAFAPIGTTSAIPFRGGYNGNGHKISNLYMESSGHTYFGLFGYLYGVVSNLILENVTVIGTEYVGGIAGYNKGMVLHCSVIGSSTVSGTGRVGGIVGDVDGSTSGTVRQCTNEATISGAALYAGGISGGGYGVISDCLNTGSISSSYSGSGSPGVGGIIGGKISWGTVKNCLNLGSVTGETGINVGGIIGYGWSIYVSNNYYLDGKAVNGIGKDVEMGGTPSNVGTLPMTSENLKLVENFTGWDFTSVWKLNPEENNGYPRLIPILPEFDIISSAAGIELLTTSVTVEDTLGTENRIVLKVLELPIEWPDIPYYGSPVPTGSTVTDPFISGSVFSVDPKVDFLAVYEVNSNNQVVKFTQFDVKVKYMEGLGTEEDPFLVTNATQLSFVNKKLNAHYKLTTDIDMTGIDDFVPIGKDWSNKFDGTFDGDNRKIINLTLNSGDYSALGLFNFIGDGTVKNLELEDLSVTSTDGWGAGGIAGCLTNGIISNCRITGDSTITGYMEVGGIVGEIGGGLIEQSSNAANIAVDEAADGGWYAVGGIAGAFYGGNISDCYNNGNVTGKTGAEIGGIVGEAWASSDNFIRNCYNIGIVTEGSYIGGIVGYLGSGALDNNFFMDTSALSGYGANEVGTDYSDHAVPKTDTELKDETNYINWDFTNVWTINANRNSGYPYLQGYVPPSTGGETATYTVTYNGNGNTGGTVPIDGNSYEQGDIVTILGNTGSLVRTGHTFVGWNTAANGSGTDYAGAATFTMGTFGVTLYAKWTANPTYTVTYNGNGNTGGTVPTDGNNYEQGDTVTVAGNTGSLVRTGYTFAGWNTAADGSGTNYAAAAPLTMGAGNVTLYAKWTATGSTSSGSGSGNTNQSQDNPLNVIIDGQNQENVGTSRQGTTSDGRITNTVTLDENKLEKILEKLPGKGAGIAAPVITIPVTGKSDVVVGELNGKIVKSMGEKEAILEIKTESVTYTLPASQINIDEVAKTVGKGVPLTSIQVQIQIATPPADTVKIVEDTANKNKYQVVVPPVEFNITCTYGDKTVEVSKFNGYVERTVALPDGIDPSKITTGIVLNPDGTFSHVPTKIIKIDGKYFAQINSLTNSTYSVIWNPMEFKDVDKHWAKEAVNDMGSRLVISGIGNELFEPGRDITRAEFAAIMVRALGLKPSAAKNTFSDVKTTDWYCGFVETAYEYGFISGYGNDKFGPNDKITREQAMTMIAKAMKITKLNAELANGEKDKMLANFTDAGIAADYAKAGIATCVKAGIVTGKGSSLMAPKDNITRAEVAVIVRSFLQKSELI